MRERGEQGSIVTLLCDSGERYRDTCFDDADWCAARGLHDADVAAAVNAALAGADAAPPWRLAGALAGGLS
jgi:cysteine synthase A